MFVLRHAQWTLNKLWCHVKGDSAVEEGVPYTIDPAVYTEAGSLHVRVHFSCSLCFCILRAIYIFKNVYFNCLNFMHGVVHVANYIAVGFIALAALGRQGPGE